MGTLQCTHCKKHSRMTVPGLPFSSPICIRCKLKCNKALLLKSFNEIVGQPNTKEFEEEMDSWYPNGV